MPNVVLFSLLWVSLNHLQPDRWSCPCILESWIRKTAWIQFLFCSSIPQQQQKLSLLWWKPRCNQEGFLLIYEKELLKLV